MWKRLKSTSPREKDPCKGAGLLAGNPSQARAGWLCPPPLNHIQWSVDMSLNKLKCLLLISTMNLYLVFRLIFIMAGSICFLCQTTPPLRGQGDASPPRTPNSVELPHIHQFLVISISHKCCKQNIGKINRSFNSLLSQRIITLL